MIFLAIRCKSLNSKNNYKGVASSGAYSWEARITINGKNWTSKGYDSEINAAKAYNLLAKIAFGEFALLNDV